MTLLNAVLVLTGLLSAGVVYGTDMFFAVVGRTALARTSDAALTEVMGRLHEVGDARMPLFGVTALLSTLALVFTTGAGSRPSVFAGLALVGLAAQLTAYFRGAQPVNHAQTAAAQQGIVPPAARALQTRWDSVIVLRAVGMTLGVLGLGLCALWIR
ncbi:DUF1772 domain-containing protein [Deinococcus sp. Arct2-2]|uniref:DUF1772 domain-containing protein n=1 Tax=Deinococcus sp. Arct2-2 TaxID=2568653 RepID=UPI0010A54A69|nr:DUF1772 domain-containing protein [Deinococcus sp. Arct2-2]THF70318.1 DUF1772 domain-containing protein [Deinococcus sp. Arct2-2]